MKLADFRVTIDGDYADEGAFFDAYDDFEVAIEEAVRNLFNQHLASYLTEAEVRIDGDAVVGIEGGS
jgi:hypothetical protein